jgi:hypothetical protein
LLNRLQLGTDRREERRGEERNTEYRIQNTEYRRGNILG